VNPFDLRGPQFLLFYLVFGLVVTVVTAWLRRQGEADTPAGGVLTDYLDIAFLRGGVNEALRVTTMTLIGRGLLQVVDGNHLRAKKGAKPDITQTPTERLVLSKFVESTAATSIFADQSLQSTVRDACEPSLISRRLLPDETIRASRRSRFFWAAVVLAGVAFVKIAVALLRGHTNVFFLLALSAIFVFVAWRVSNPRRTRAGDLMLADLKRLFKNTRTQTVSQRMGADAPRSSAHAQELSLVAAVFGIVALNEVMPDARKLFPQASSSDSTSGCGSSSSDSSSSDGGGSSCGGGGGCGGCGSS
jgi:uncharacterized protein (TIGR04222 family)